MPFQTAQASATVCCVLVLLSGCGESPSTFIKPIEQAVVSVVVEDTRSPESTKAVARRSGKTNAAEDRPVHTLKVMSTKLSDGPLMFLIKPDESTGERWEGLHVIDPERGLVAHRCVTAPGNLNLIHRIGNSRLLTYSHSSGSRELVEGYFLIDFEKGAATQLFSDSRFGAKLIKSDGGTLFFLVHQGPRAHPFAFEVRRENEALKIKQPRDRLFRVDAIGELKSTQLFDRDIVDVREAGKRDYLVVAEDHKSRELELWRVAKDGTSRTKVLDHVDKIVSESTDQLLVATKTKPPRLWQVMRQTAGKKDLLALDPSWNHQFTSCVLSPNRRRIALGVASSDQDLGTRNLVVFDFDTQKWVYELRDIRIGMSPTDKPLDVLRFVWLDDRRIRFSESRFTNLKPFENHKNRRIADHAKDGVFQWVDVDTVASKTLDRRVYGAIWSVMGMWPRHGTPQKDKPESAAQTPSDTARTRNGFFEEEWGLLYFAGDKKPICDFAKDNYKIISESGDISVSPKGNWAAYTSSQDGYALHFINGRSRETKVVMRGWAYAYQWFPSVANSESKR